MPIEGADAFPLYWPPGCPRAKHRTSSPYQATALGQNRDLVLKSLSHMTSRRDFVVSTNIPLTRDGLPYASAAQRIPDPGVAVYWVRGGRPHVIACDRWLLVGENLRAIWYALESLRQIERCGASQIIEQAYAGFAALPAANRDKPWEEVLCLARLGFGDYTREDIEQAYRKLALLHHPDRGGSSERMAEINRARDQALAEIERRG